MSVALDIAAIVARYKAKGLFTHAFVARGRLSEAAPYFVHKDYADAGEVFDLASLTKALVTTPLLFERRDENGRSFADTIGQWLGTQALPLDPRLRALTVRDLLQHTSGLPAWRNFWICRLGPEVATVNSEGIRDHVIKVLQRAASDLSNTNESVYSDVGFILLGLLLEATDGRAIHEQFADFCRSKLRIDPATPILAFAKDHPDGTTFISTGTCLIRGRRLSGEVHDENCAAMGGVAGHAGLFGSGEAVCAFLSALALSPVGRRLLAENAAARQLPVGLPPNEALLGWRQATTPSSWPFGQGAAMGHMGFTGVAFWLWPEAGEYVTLLTNRVISGRVSPDITAMRREVFTALAAL